MEKESVKKFDLEAAFKALDEIEIPAIEKGSGRSKANRVDLKERFSHKPATETLVEDYYDVSSNEDLEEAKEEREGEVAQAKLARIEKIVDLDAETADDLLPSYVGKYIIQCPQCMTLFYKNEEDIEKSEENPDVVNINEICQHCGNSSGYTLIGKVDAVGSDEADKYEEAPVEEAPAEENELDLEFPEEETSEEPSEEDLDLDLDLEEVPEEEPEETNESLNAAEAAPSEEESENKPENVTLNEEVEDVRGFISELDAREDKSLTAQELDAIAAKHGVKKPYDPAIMSRVTIKEGLTEEVDKDLDAKLKAHNDYIAYLQQMIKQEEETLKKAENEEIKAAIQRRLDAFSADLEAALPDAVKEEPVEEPTIEETPAEEEAVEESVKEEELPTEEPVEECVKEELTEETEETPECKVVLSDKPEKEVFAGSKEDCEKIIEKNKDTNTAKEHGLEIVEPAVEESLNASEVQKDAEEMSELKTENESENLTLNESLTEGAEAEIDTIIASWGDVSEGLTEDNNLDKLLDSDEFKTPVSEEEINDIKAEVKEESLEECNKQSLTEEPEDEAKAIVAGWTEEEQKENAVEGYTGNPAERTTHLEYTDDDPTDGKAVLPDNIEKQLTEGEECEEGECEKPLEECGEKPLKEEDEVPAEEEAPVEEPVEEPVEGEEAVEEEPKEELPNVEFNTEEVKEVAQEAAEEVIKEAEADVEPEIVEEKVEEVVADAVEEKVEAEEATSEEAIAEEPANDLEFNEESVDELDESSLNEHINNYLTEVYSNVKSFETTGCELKEGKLFVDGKISFNSGNEKLTVFEFLPNYCEGKLFFEGYNKDFSEDKAFTLNCLINESKTLITESFGYKYKINETLIEGLK